MSRRKYLPWIRSATSVTHIDIAIAMIIFFMFQMAILPSFFKFPCFGRAIITDGVRTSEAQSTVHQQQRQYRQKTRKKGR
jgi:hypothetical protein